MSTPIRTVPWTEQRIKTMIEATGLIVNDVHAAETTESSYWHIHRTGQDGLQAFQLRISNHSPMGGRSYRCRNHGRLAQARYDEASILRAVKHIGSVELC